MDKQDILNYVKGYYTKYRLTKNGLFIYGKTKELNNQKYTYYTYVSRLDINNKDNTTIENIKFGLDMFIIEQKEAGLYEQ